MMDLDVKQKQNQNQNKDQEQECNSSSISSKLQQTTRMGNKHLSNDLITSSQGDFPHSGNQTGIDSFLFTPNQHQTNHWLDVTEQNVYYRIQYGKFHVYRNQITYNEIQNYKLVLKDKQLYDKFTLLSQWRNNSIFTPKIERIVVLNQTQICVKQYQLNIFMQRIPLRLADLTDIPFPQNLYFLTSILKGYKYIFDSSYIMKMFKVTQTMIGLNQEGEVKVWWSSNLIDMDAVDDDKKEEFVSEEEFVRRVIDLVEDNTDERDYPYPFRKYLRQRNIPINGDFTLIINQLFSYAKQMNITIPKCSYSVCDILKRDESNKNQSQTSLVSNRLECQNKNKGVGGNMRECQSKNKYLEGQLTASIQFNNNNNWMRHENDRVEVVGFQHKPNSLNIRHKEQAPSNPTLAITKPMSGNFNYSSPQFHSHQQITTHSKNKEETVPNYAIHRLGQNIIQLTNNLPLHNEHKQLHYSAQYHTTPSSLIPHYHDDRNQQMTRFVVVGDNNNKPRVQFNKNTHINNQFMGWNHEKQPYVGMNTNAHHHMQQPYGIINRSVTDKQIGLNPVARLSSGKLQNQFSYNNLNPPTEYVQFQKQTSTFSPMITPNFTYPTIYTLPNNNNNNNNNSNNNNNNNTKSEPSSYFHRKQPCSKQKQQFAMPKSIDLVINKSKVHKEINSSELLNRKLKYYARKDSQQTLDPQIASDLAKYLN